MDVVIIGSGVSGLTTGVALLEAGHAVRIVTMDPLERTTSIVAAAFWYPYEAPPIHEVPAWGVRSLAEFYTLAEIPEAGVFVTTVRELSVEPLPEQPWSAAVAGFRMLQGTELPAGYGGGFEFETVRIEPPVYLPHLLARFEAGGGILEVTGKPVENPADVAPARGAVVNCTGLGSAGLVGDTTVYPIRGQVVAVTNPGIGDGVIDESDADAIAYVLPRSDEVILGGTRQVGNSDLSPDDTTTSRILADCLRLDPRLKGVQVRDVRVGLRPGRPEVRVEVEPAPWGWLAHNYGHAGNGYGLSWGCAFHLVELLDGVP